MRNVHCIIIIGHFSFFIVTKINMIYENQNLMMICIQYKNHGKSYLMHLNEVKTFEY